MTRLTPMSSLGLFVSGQEEFEHQTFNYVYLLTTFTYHTVHFPAMLLLVVRLVSTIPYTPLTRSFPGVQKLLYLNNRLNYFNSKFKIKVYKSVLLPLH